MTTKRGRPPKGDKPMSSTERSRKRRGTKAPGKPRAKKKGGPAEPTKPVAVPSAPAVAPTTSVTTVEHDPDRCPRCNALYALVGHSHRCRGGEG